MDDIWLMVDRQRASVADLFAGLDDEQWRRQSLCAGWTVRDVGAHLTLQGQPAIKAIGMALRHLGPLNRVIERSAQAAARTLTTDQIVERQRALIGRHVPNAFLTVGEALVDIVVHGLDVAVPLGLDLEIPDETVVATLDRLASYRGTSKAKVFGPVVADRFRATDVDWSFGTGDQAVQLPARDLLLTLSGRTPVSASP